MTVIKKTYTCASHIKRKAKRKMLVYHTFQDAIQRKYGSCRKIGNDHGAYIIQSKRKFMISFDAEFVKIRLLDSKIEITYQLPIFKDSDNKQILKRLENHHLIEPCKIRKRKKPKIKNYKKPLKLS